MAFSIRHTTHNGLDLIELKDDHSETLVSLLPAYGACIHAFSLLLPDGTVYNVIDHYQSLEELKQEMERSYKGPKLSPFPCRIPAGTYRFEEKEYHFAHLFNDGTAIHGLLASKPFTVLEEVADSTRATLSLEYIYKNEDPGYPFEYNCGVKYTLQEGNTLEIVTTVTNLDKTTIPIADGWHPYFQLGGKVNDWQLQFLSSAIVEFDDKLVPTGKLLPYDRFNNPHMIGDTFLDNCFTLKPGIVSPACELYNPTTGLKISILPDESYPYLQIYTPATRTSIAIENLSGAPDCFNNKMGLTLLARGHSQIFTTRYKVVLEEKK